MAFLNSNSQAVQALSRLSSVGNGRGEPGATSSQSVNDSFLPNFVTGPPKRGGGLPSLVSGRLSPGSLPIGNLTNAPKLVTNVSQTPTTVPLMSYRDFFHQNLEKWPLSIPLRTQWLIFIDKIPPGVSTEMLQELEPVNGNKKSFDIDEARRSLNTYSVQEIAGCILAQGVNIPDDSSEVAAAPIPNNRGFIQGKVGGNRSSFNNLTIEFRETNTSFVDMVIRPWVILTSHAGLVARDRFNDVYKNPKCNITVINLGKTLPGVAMVHRKIFNFYNCVPITVSTRNLTYDAESMEAYATSWAYTHYDVQENDFIPGISFSVEQISKSRNIPSNDFTGTFNKNIKRPGIMIPVTQVKNNIGGLANKIINAAAPNLPSSNKIGGLLGTIVSAAAPTVRSLVNNQIQQLTNKAFSKIGGNSNNQILNQVINAVRPGIENSINRQTQQATNNLLGKFVAPSSGGQSSNTANSSRPTLQRVVNAQIQNTVAALSQAAATNVANRILGGG